MSLLDKIKEQKELSQPITESPKEVFDPETTESIPTDLRRLKSHEQKPDDSIPEFHIEPKVTCGRCYGRGYIGVNVVTNSLVYCRCVTRVAENKLKLVGKTSCKIFIKEKE